MDAFSLAAADQSAAPPCANVGTIQDLITQNFLPKADSRVATHPALPLAEQLWTNAVARLLFGPAASIQAPPNLRSGALGALVTSGINDWGGVSPVTPDYVNPEAPWPAIADLERSTRATGRELCERLAITPSRLRARGFATAGLIQRSLRVCADSSTPLVAPEAFVRLAASIGRTAWQRTTGYLPTGLPRMPSDCALRGQSAVDFGGSV